MNLHKLLIDVCRRAQLKKIPKLTVCKGTDAHTLLNKIRIGRILCSHLTEEEMKGVIAHEVHHVKKLIKYPLVTIIVEALSMSALLVAGPVGYLFLINEFPALISYFPPSTFPGIMAVPILLFWLALNRYISRTKELRADKFAAPIVGGRTFAKALKKVYSIPSKTRLWSRIWELFNPHPSLNKRLEAIRNVKRLPYPARQLASIREKAKPE